MKKSFVVIMLITLCAFSYSEDCMSEYFNKFFDPKASCYDFLCTNPFFSFIDNKITVSNLNELKGKILKTKFVEYDIYKSKDGKFHEHYGDSDARSVCIKYFLFDNKGQIEKQFSLIGNSDGYYSRNYSVNYEFKDKTYLISEKTRFPDNSFSDKDLQNNYVLTDDDEKTIVSNIYKSKNLCYLLNIEEFTVSLNKIIAINSNKFNSFEKTTIWTDNGNTRLYQRKSGNTPYELKWEETYKNGILIRETFINGEKGRGKTYTVTEGIGKVVSFDIADGKEEINGESYLERKINDAGFLEYEIVRPMKDGDCGKYTIYTAEVFSEKDEFFYRYFK